MNTTVNTESRRFLLAPALFAGCLALLAAAGAAMPPEAAKAFFDQGGYSPFELATLPFFALIVPLVWWRNPFAGSRRRRIAFAAAVSVVAVMAIVKETDLHNAFAHWCYPQIVGADGSIAAGAGLVKPNGSPLTGTAFKMRVLTNGAVPAGLKAIVVGYFALFFGVFAVGFALLLPAWVRGVVALRPDAWFCGCFGASGLIVQIADRLPAWLRHSGVEGRALPPKIVVFEEGGEMMIAVFAILAILAGNRERRRENARKAGC